LLPILYAKGNRKTTTVLTRLRKEAMHDKAPRVALRIHGVLLSLERHSVPDIARLLHMDRTTVHGWITRWNTFGKESLLEGHRSGRPSELTEKDKEKLRDIVDSGPVAYGLDTGIWTSVNLAEVIEYEFDVHYHPGHVRRLLHQIGLSVQRPTTRLIEGDPIEQNRWKRYTYPNLKKKPPLRAES
jgi:transposase